MISERQFHLVRDALARIFTARQQILQRQLGDQTVVQTRLQDRARFRRKEFLARLVTATQTKRRRRRRCGRLRLGRCRRGAWLSWPGRAGLYLLRHTSLIVDTQDARIRRLLLRRRWGWLPRVGRSRRYGRRRVGWSLSWPRRPGLRGSRWLRSGLLGSRVRGSPSRLRGSRLSRGRLSWRGLRRSCRGLVHIVGQVMDALEHRIQFAF